jgi:hypothetical protein
MVFYYIKFVFFIYVALIKQIFLFQYYISGIIVYYLITIQLYTINTIMTIQFFLLCYV